MGPDKVVGTCRGDASGRSDQIGDLTAVVVVALVRNFEASVLEDASDIPSGSRETLAAEGGTFADSKAKHLYVVA
jgi:hypothetical protein